MQRPDDPVAINDSDVDHVYAWEVVGYLHCRGSKAETTVPLHPPPHIVRRSLSIHQMGDRRHIPEVECLNVVRCPLADANRPRAWGRRAWRRPQSASRHENKDCERTPGSQPMP